MTQSPVIRDVDPQQAAEMVSNGALLLDVREDDEWTNGHAPGAVHLPLGELQAATFDTRPAVVAVCRSGNRSAKAAEKLAAAGVDVVNLAGGMRAWAQAGLPVVDADGRRGRV